MIKYMKYTKRNTKKEHEYPLRCFYMWKWTFNCKKKKKLNRVEVINNQKNGHWGNRMVCRHWKDRDQHVTLLIKICN